MNIYEKTMMQRRSDVARGDIYVPDEEIERFRQCLSVLRVACGYSQSDISELIGVTRMTFWKFETGRTGMSRTYYYALSYIFEKCEGFGVLRRKLVAEKDDDLLGKLEFAVRLTGTKAGIEEQRREMWKEYGIWTASKRIKNFRGLEKA